MFPRAKATATSLAIAVLLAACSQGDNNQSARPLAQASAGTAVLAPSPSRLQLDLAAKGALQNAKFGLSPQRPAVPGEFLVKFRSGTPRSGVVNVLNQFSLKSSRPVGRTSGLHRVKLAAGVDGGAALAAYRANPDVEYVEPNYLVRAHATPNDPRFVEQWPLHNTGQTGGNNDADIDAPEAWDVTTGDSGVVVAVIDSGVDYTHPDLAANIYRNTADCDGDHTDSDGNGYVDDCRGIDTANDDSDPMDDAGHGTHVAGIAGAVGNNGIGITGVAWNARILPCKFLDANGVGSIGDAIECLNYIADLKDRGVNIVATNNSYGVDTYSQAMHDAIREQMQRGILFVTSAGNDGEDISDSPIYFDGTLYPCAYYLPNVLCVTVSGSLDGPDPFSNTSRTVVHLAAPGDSVLSTFPGNSYGVLSGTSMAAPHVAGTIALLKSATPGLDWRAAKNLIMTGGDPISFEFRQRGLDYVTVAARRLNANGSLTCTDTTVTQRVQPRPRVPMTWRLGDPLTLAVLNVRCANPNGNVSVTINPQGTVVQLLDNGAGSDLVAGDGIYSAAWTPTTAGRHTLIYPAPADGIIVDVDAHLEPGFPVKTLRTGGSRVNWPELAIGNIDADANLEILAPGLLQGPTYAWKANGELVPGWPILSSGSASDSAAFLALGNLSGSPNQLEIAAGYNGFPGVAEMYRGDGTLLPGWPHDVAVDVANVPGLVDIDGDGIDEMFVAENDFTLHAYRADGTGLSGFPVGTGPLIGGQGVSSPMIADVDADGEAEIFAHTDRVILGVRSDGSRVPGWPADVATSFNLIGIGDVDADGSPEIVRTLGLQDNNSVRLILSLLDRGGRTKLEKELLVTSGSAIPSPGALADLTGDGVPEIVFTSVELQFSRRRIHVVDGKGVALPGWPVDLAGRAAIGWDSGPVVGDVDGDGLPEIVLAADGALFVFDHDGSSVAGFPKEVPAFKAPQSAAIADIDRDNRNEIIVYGDESTQNVGWYRTIWVYDLGGPTPHGPIEWGQYHGNSRRHGYYELGKNLPTQAYLSVQSHGEGSVASSSPGINCGDDCLQLYTKGASVTLTATPAGGTTFAGWTGGCAGQGNPCTITIDRATAVAAKFGTYSLSVALEGPEAESITSAPGGISCPTDCEGTFAAGSQVVLTASPQAAFSHWSGACFGFANTCTVTMDAAKFATAHFTSSHPTAVEVTVDKNGDGSGRVVSSPGGILCGSDCTESFQINSIVELTATADAGSEFVGWTGACNHAANPCTVITNEAKSVTATFAKPQILTIARTGSGSGIVHALPGIDCGSDCSEIYFQNSVVDLIAQAEPGSTFVQWAGGACDGSTVPTCSVTMNGSTTVTARFELVPLLSVAVSGNGAVSSNPAGINCGIDCSEGLVLNSSVTLTAAANPGSQFGGWSGACSGSAVTCTLIMDAAKNVTATFNIPPSPPPSGGGGGGGGGGSFDWRMLAALGLLVLAHLLLRAVPSRTRLGVQHLDRPEPLLRVRSLPRAWNVLDDRRSSP
jgi:subtilisin family serine protease